jgi:hypothetical protein
MAKINPRTGLPYKPRGRPFTPGHSVGNGRKGGAVARKHYNMTVKDFLHTLRESMDAAGGKEGAIGYLKWLAKAYPALYVAMISKALIPDKLQVDLTRDTLHPLTRVPTVEEIEAEFARRGLPVPQNFLGPIDFTRCDRADGIIEEPDSSADFELRERQVANRSPRLFAPKR